MKLSQRRDGAEVTRLTSALDATRTECAALREEGATRVAERVEMESRVDALRAKLGDLGSLCDDTDALDAALKASQAAEAVAQQRCTDAKSHATSLEASLRTAEEAFYKRVADLELAWKGKVKCCPVICGVCITSIVLPCPPRLPP